MLNNNPMNLSTSTSVKVFILLGIFTLISCNLNNENVQEVKRIEIKNSEAPRVEKPNEAVKEKNSNQVTVVDSLLKHHKKEPDPSYWPYYHLTPTMLDSKVYYKDTVTVSTSKELIAHIQSDRLIRLTDEDYILRDTPEMIIDNQDTTYYFEKQGILVDSVKNLKIVGTGKSRLLAHPRNATVLKFRHVHNIELDNIEIGHTEMPGYDCESGVLIINYAYNIKITNCKLFGSGTVGLSTYAVYNMELLDSEIAECTEAIFVLSRTRKAVFKNTRLHNHRVSFPQLASFRNASKELSFINCVFENNSSKDPDLAENSIFGIHDLEEKILFDSCTFSNNPDFNWFGDGVRLVDCMLDKETFMDFQGNYTNAAKLERSAK